MKLSKLELDDGNEYLGGWMIWTVEKEIICFDIFCTDIFVTIYFKHSSKWPTGRKSNINNKPKTEHSQ